MAGPEADRISEILLTFGWACYFASRGIDVRAWDPDSGAADLFLRTVDQAWPAMEAMGLAPGASPDRVVFLNSAAEAVEGASLVQESAPERLELKQDLLADLDGWSHPGAILASSTSGYRVSELAAAFDEASELEGLRPLLRGRLLTAVRREAQQLVAEVPAQPGQGRRQRRLAEPQLLCRPRDAPLVELVAGPGTSRAVMDRAADFYAMVGKTVLRLEREVDGFVADRLQEAMWWEALHMLANGEATVEQLDLSITAGPGLRWALMGPMLTFHLAGGEGGMAHMLDHFGPSLSAPWTRLKAPELTPDLRAAAVAGCEEEAAGRSVGDLVRERDRGLVAILRALQEIKAVTPGEG